MRLSSLLKMTQLTPDPEIRRLCLDSRDSQPGDLFIALQGSKQDGRAFVAEALAKQAAGILLEGAQEGIEIQSETPLITLPNLRDKLGLLAAQFYDFPTNKLRMLGVTGTSGKTSCTHYFAESLTRANIRCGVIGTLGCGYVDELQETGLTTPDAIKLHATLKEFLQQQAQAIAMEVSSHGIDQGRINGINYEVGVFTNLTQDHLDYHKDLQTYANVKYRFLASGNVKQLLLNLDDNYGKKWLSELLALKKVYTYSLCNPHASVYAKNIQYTEPGITTTVCTPWGEGELNLPLRGLFNLSNALAVLGALCIFGISLQEALAHLSKVKAVPGRMQPLGGGGQPTVIVDYAHKPDALEKVLQALRKHAAGKVICVFGCGGERDRSKRALMAQIAEKWADKIIVTNDNPRHEDPILIVQEIMSGFAEPTRVLIELDRAKAIEKSIQWAAAGDYVLIAGKGAEHYQQIGDVKKPFNDITKVKEYLFLND